MKSRATQKGSGMTHLTTLDEHAGAIADSRIAPQGMEILSVQCGLRLLQFTTWDRFEGGPNRTGR